MVASRHRARAERAAGTRGRIVAAAAPLFVRDGYLETTMAGIARAAGVAVQTLYLPFGSKSAVLEAALQVGVDDEPVEWPARLAAQSDGRAALAGYAEATAGAVERRYPMYAVLRAAAADPEPATLLQRARRTALAGHARAVDELAEKAGFTTGTSLQRATEIVDTVLSPEAYELLVIGHGWPSPDWVQWAVHHLAVDLFPEH